MHTARPIIPTAVVLGIIGALVLFAPSSILRVSLLADEQPGLGDDLTRAMDEINTEFTQKVAALLRERDARIARAVRKPLEEKIAKLKSDLAEREVAIATLQDKMVFGFGKPLATPARDPGKDTPALTTDPNDVRQAVIAEEKPGQEKTVTGKVAEVETAGEPEATIAESPNEVPSQEDTPSASVPEVAAPGTVKAETDVDADTDIAPVAAGSAGADVPDPVAAKPARDPGKDTPALTTDPNDVRQAVIAEEKPGQEKTVTGKVAEVETAGEPEATIAESPNEVPSQEDTPSASVPEVAAPGTVKAETDVDADTDIAPVAAGSAGADVPDPVAAKPAIAESDSDSGETLVGGIDQETGTEPSEVPGDRNPVEIDREPAATSPALFEKFDEESDPVDSDKVEQDAIKEDEVDPVETKPGPAAPAEPEGVNATEDELSDDGVLDEGASEADPDRVEDLDAGDRKPVETRALEDTERDSENPNEINPTVPESSEDPEEQSLSPGGSTRADREAIDPNGDDDLPVDD